MKKTLLSILAIMSFSVSTMAQAGWISVNSGLTVGYGIGQISIGMNNPNALWAEAVDGTGAIVDGYTMSTDGGQTWTPGTFNAGTGLSQLFAIDENTCWAVMNTGANQGCYKTIDGGATWVKKGTAYSAGSFADAMHFFNANDGFAEGDPLGGYFELYTTTDGGDSWTRVPQANIPAPTSGEYGITGDICAVGDNIWFGTNAGRIFHSTDKGYTWTASLTVFGNTETVAPIFADPLNGFAYRSYLNLGLESALDVTTDGGATWTEIGVIGDMYARYFSYVPGTTGMYVGSSSAVAPGNGISYSSDGGVTWTTITAGYNFTASAWINDSTGWAGSVTTAKKSTGGMYIFDGVLTALQAQFTASDTAIELGGTVTFTDQSMGNNITGWSWTFTDGIPPTSTVQNPPPVTYVVSGAHNVSLTVTDAGGGQNTLTKIDYIYVGGVGINELSVSSINVYPNPVKDVMTVESASTIQEIQIFNIIGQMVYNQKVDGKTVTLNTNLKNGVYNLKVKFANGFVNKKIVIN